LKGDFPLSYDENYSSLLTDEVFEGGIEWKLAFIGYAVSKRQNYGFF